MMISISVKAQYDILLAAVSFGRIEDGKIFKIRNLSKNHNKKVVRTQLFCTDFNQTQLWINNVAVLTQDTY